MSEASPSNQREFFCGFCHGRILIPRDLPPTTAPCPHCGQSITSPALAGVPLPVPALGAEAPVSQAPVSSPAVIPPVMVEPAVIVAPAQVVAPVQAVAVTPVPSAGSSVAEIISPVKSVPLESVSLRPGMKLQSPHDANEPPPVPPRKGFLDADGAGDPALAKNAKRKESSLLVPILVMLGLIIVAAGVYILLSRTHYFSNAPVEFSPAEQKQQKEQAYLRDGWRKEAVELLDKFESAPTPEAKAQWVLNPGVDLPLMREFYGFRKRDDSDAPAIAFAEFPLPDSDRQRGMFMMVYEQPPQLNLRQPFFPLQTLEVQNGLVDPQDGSKEGMLLTAAARVSNFASEEIRVQALFKRTPDGLRLDWPSFVQSKYRTFRDFIDLPNAGKSSVFRILIQEDVPDRGRIVPGSRAYKILDPGNPTDSVRVNVPVDSDMGHSLSAINWIGIPNSRAELRTATAELEWSKEESPQLQMKRFICWEFLGLGGEPGR